MFQSLKQLVKKLSIFDLSLLVVAVLIPAFIFLFFRRQEDVIEIKLQVTDKDVLYAGTAPNLTYSDSFRVGDVEKNEIGQIIAEITKVDAFPISRTHKITFLTIKVKSLYNPRKELFSLRGKPIIYGESFKFNFRNAVVEGLIVNYPGYTPSSSEDKTIHVETQLRYDDRQFSDVYGVPGYIADQVKENDEVKDSQGRVYAKILTKRVVPAKRTVLMNGSAVQVVDPDLKDVYFTIELYVKKRGNDYFLYDLIPVAVTESLPLSFSNISVFPTILKILDEENEFGKE